jgi:hypothetical protein
MLTCLLSFDMLPQLSSIFAQWVALVMIRVVFGYNLASKTELLDPGCELFFLGELLQIFDALV